MSCVFTFFTDQEAANKQNPSKPDHDPNDYEYDPSYAFVELHNRYLLKNDNIAIGTNNTA